MKMSIQYPLFFSKGILKIPHLPHFFPKVPFTYVGIKSWRLCFLKKSSIDAVCGWGFRPTAKKAREYATKHQLPYIALEDGFLRSVGLGVEGYPPFSLVYDDVGIYYATMYPSRLENLILHFQADADWAQQAKKAIHAIVSLKLSKYNHAPEKIIDRSDTERSVVLVIDQTFGDMAVKYGQASEHEFNQMLQVAIDENPNAEIWVKTHPDVISGKKQGYLTKLPEYQDKVRLISENINPLSLCEQVDKVYCVTSQMGFEALMLGKIVVTFGVPWFAGWGLTDDRHPLVNTLIQAQRRQPRTLHQLFYAAYMQYSRYIDPNTGVSGTIFDVIAYLQTAKRLDHRLSGDIHCVGISLWKRAIIRSFFRFPNCRLHFYRTLSDLKKVPMTENSRLLVWGAGKTEQIAFAQQRQLPLLRMEDGFIRSVGLGSNLVPPLSLVIDDLGIYFDATRPSRLEYLLQNTDFTDEYRAMGEQLIQRLVEQRVGKYNVGSASFSVDTSKRKILVPGQVEDDASIRLGAPQINKNLALLKQVREDNPDAYVIYKPHPDVISGNRVGDIPDEQALAYADKIESEANILHCIDAVDEVHTMTSLAGFEALLRGKQVYCYGSPFYAHWGLTHDYLSLSRRQRKLELSELVYATLVLYPQYVHPESRNMINVDTAIHILAKQLQQSQVGRIKRPWIQKQLTKLKQLYITLIH